MERLNDGIVARLAIAAYSIGFASSLQSFLTVSTGATLGCSGGECDIVAFHPLSFIFGVHLSLIGVFWYLINIAILTGWILCNKSNYLIIAKIISVLGLLVSVFLIYTMSVVIGSTCVRCLISAASSSVAAILLSAKISLPLLWSKILLNISIVAVIAVPIIAVGLVAQEVVAQRELVRKYALHPVAKLAGLSAATLVDNGIQIGKPSDPTVISFIDPYCGVCHYKLTKLLTRLSNGERIRLVIRFGARNPGEMSLLAFQAIYQCSNALSAITLLDQIATKRPKQPSEVFEMFFSCDRKRLQLNQTAHDRLQKDLEICKRMQIESVPIFVFNARNKGLKSSHNVPISSLLE